MPSHKFTASTRRGIRRERPMGSSCVSRTTSWGYATNGEDSIRASCESDHPLAIGLRVPLQGAGLSNPILFYTHGLGTTGQGTGTTT